jgi:hypothetical protein
VEHFCSTASGDVEETKSKLPDHMKKYLAENNISNSI